MVQIPFKIPGCGTDRALDQHQSRVTVVYY